MRDTARQMRSAMMCDRMRQMSMCDGMDADVVRLFPEKSGKLRGHTAGLVGQCDPDSGRKINLIVKQIFKKY